VTRPSISAVLLRPLAAAMGAMPGAAKSLAEFFTSSDLTPQTLADADARVSPAQFCVAWAEAVRLSGDPALALRIAQASPPGAFGIVEYVCRSAPTLREALLQWVRYLTILDDAVEVGLVDSPGGASLRVLAESEAPAPASHELCFALVKKTAQSMSSGPFRLAGVRFDHRAPSADPKLLARYRDFFSCSVEFGAAHTEMLFEHAILEQPLRTADPDLYAILLPAAEAQRSTKRPEALFAEQVRRALPSAFRSEATQLEQIAQALGVTPRNLQRRLKDEGFTFQIVRDEARRELADRYLRDGLSLAEISFLLGFSEPSAFFRAFKRWTGATPIAHRAHLLLA
jgi:AraC-like DNA-binding protein